MALRDLAQRRPQTAAVSVMAEAVIRGAGKASQHCLDARRAAFAGGVWLLVLYSACTVLFVTRRAPGTGMLPFWDAFLPGFDGSSNLGIALGFPLSFLYGAMGAWFLAMLYNIAPPGAREGTEAK